MISFFWSEVTPIGFFHSFRVVNFVAQVTVEQKYINRENRPIETVYFFPVEEESAVVELEAEIDGRTIKTEVKKREEANQEYNQVQFHVLNFGNN